MQDTNWLLERIQEIIRDCEYVKESGVSRHLEEQQEIVAYNRIKELCNGESERGNM